MADHRSPGIVVLGRVHIPVQRDGSHERESRKRARVVRVEGRWVEVEPAPSIARSVARRLRATLSL